MNKARAAEKLQRDIRDLDHEYPEVPAATAAAADLDHTDTLPFELIEKEATNPLPTAGPIENGDSEDPVHSPTDSTI